MYKAYHNDSAKKQFYIERMQAHMDADELVRRIGWKDGKGCAVGCILNSYEHSAFPDELGIPEWAARLLDTLHENTSAEVWPTLSMRFLTAIKEGVDISPVRNQIIIFILNGNIERVEKLDISDEIKQQVVDATKQCIEVQRNYDDSAAFSVAQSTAVDAAKSVIYDHKLAARPAWSAEAVEFAARSAEAAARSAESSVAVAVVDAAARSARLATYDIMANEFVRLLELAE